MWGIAMSDIHAVTAQEAAEAYNKQARFHQVCAAIVASEINSASLALEEAALGHRGTREVCHRIATAVAARVLQTVYENDAELKAWKTFAERATETALESLTLRGPALVLPRAY